jgi:peptidoglycan/xylan/chitin deacetylase (PgdA/CDA1 family)
MVSKKPNGFYPEISVRSFERQIAHITKNYKVIPLKEIVKRIKNKESIRRCIAVTFDDGFKDNYENAYKILKRYDTPATIFLATKFIDSGSPPWFIKERYIFMKTKKTQFKLAVDDRKFNLSMKTKREKFIASEEMMTYLKNCSENKRQGLLKLLCEVLEVDKFHELNGLMLNWDQVIEMSQNGVTFGAHTVSHPVLSKISLYSAEREILESKETIISKTEKPVTKFAYPFGKREEYNTELFPVLKRLGFDCAVTTEAGPNCYNNNIFELRRSAPWELNFQIR